MNLGEKLTVESGVLLGIWLGVLALLSINTLNWMKWRGYSKGEFHRTKQQLRFLFIISFLVLFCTLGNWVFESFDIENSYTWKLPIIIAALTLFFFGVWGAIEATGLKRSKKIKKGNYPSP